jgi:hypothetical protein
MPIAYPYNGNPAFPKYNPLNRCHLHITDAQLSKGFANTLRPIKKELFLFTQQPTMSDIKQGILGNCYLLAALISILNHHNGANHLANIVATTQINGESKIGVRLYVHNNFINQLEAIYIYFDPTIFVSNENGKLSSFDKSKHWVHYLQKAYYIFQTFIYPQIAKLQINPDVYKKFQTGVHGGYSNEIFTLLLGTPSKKIILSSPYHREDLFMPFPPEFGLAHYSLEENELFTAIKTALNENQLLCADSKIQQMGVEDPYKGYHGIVPRHAYSIIGYREGAVLLPDNTTRILKFLLLANPWKTYIRRYAWRFKPPEGFFSSDFILSAHSEKEVPYASYPYFGNLYFTQTNAERIPKLDLDAQSGVFAIELADFFDCFDQIHFCQGDRLNKPAIY